MNPECGIEAFFPYCVLMFWFPGHCSAFPGGAIGVMVLDSWRMTHTGLSGRQMTSSHSVTLPARERDITRFTSFAQLKSE